VICRGPKCTKHLRTNEKELCSTCSFNLPLATIQKIRSEPRANGRQSKPVGDGDGAVRAGASLTAKAAWRRA
jgi:hypothetical protein